MDGGGSPRFDFGAGFFLDGGDHNFVPLRPRRVEDAKGEVSVTRDNSDLFREGHAGDSVNESLPGIFKDYRSRLIVAT